MKPVRLRARNFRTFPDLDIAFEDGLVGILGELRDAPEGADSNGAGKSSILEAIDIALFGRRSLSGFLTRGGYVDELMLELTFEHAGDLYRVRRTYSAKGRGKTSLDFESFKEAPLHSGDDTGPQWDPLTRSSARETDELIVETIGLSRQTFRDSCYLRQGDGSYADPARDARQRKELLVEAVMGRDPVWPKLAELAKQRRKEAQQQLERVAAESATARELVATKPSAVEERDTAAAAAATAATLIETAEADLATVTARYQAARDALAKRQTAEAELREARQALGLLLQHAAAADTAAAQIAETRVRVAELTTAPDTDSVQRRLVELQAQADEHERARQEHLRTTDAAKAAELRRDEQLARARERRTNAAALRTKAEETLATVGTAHCDRCQQTLGAEAAARAADSYRQEAEQSDNQAETLEVAASTLEIPTVTPAPQGAPPTDQLATVRGQLRAAQEASAERARLDERIAQLEQAAAARPSAVDLDTASGLVKERADALAEIEPVAALEDIEQAGRGVRARVEVARTDREQAVALLARCDERLAQIGAAEEKLDGHAQETKQLQTQIDRDVLLEQAEGRDGIPALIIENVAIPYLETEASRIMRELGARFQVELRTQQERKDGSGLRDTLDVVVIDESGDEAEFADGTSGGEQTRIGLALRIALARLLGHRRGAESKLLALDEPSYLDQAGMQALLEVLRGLEDEFDVILLVSHVPELRDALDATITVIKDGGRSRVADESMAVAA